jgi:pimeloyl-ACP methyl ester carboxylesterase
MPETPTPDRSGHIPLGEHRVYYEYFGAGDREAVCLLNGLAMSTDSWYGFLPRLRPEFDVMLYDYPGQGRSTTLDVPYLIPDFAHALTRVADALEVARFHLMGISYGGFVALEYARLYQRRLHTLTLSGILLTREELFEMYEELSLRFYRSGPLAFELYTHYMYEKIFGEDFVRVVRPKLEAMRQNFEARWKDKIHCLIRLTEAQDPLFAALEANDAGYRAVETPTLIMAGAEDRAIPPGVQRKIADLLPNARFELVPGSGHVVYLEKPDHFFDNLKRLARARSLLAFEPATLSSE